MSLSGSGIIHYFEGIREQDLEHLYPAAGCLVIDDPMPTNLSFEVNTRSGLEEVEYKDGFNPMAETNGLDIESIRISPLGFVLTAASKDQLDVGSAFSNSHTYCLMEDGSKVEVDYSGSSISSGGTTRYNLNFIVNDMLLDARKVKAIYMNDQLFWSRQQ